MLIKNGDTIIAVGRTGYNYSTTALENQLEDYNAESDGDLVEWLIEETGVLPRDIVEYRRMGDIDYEVS